MDFLDKIGNIAKNIGDRTNDAIEITKLNAKIASEKNAVGEDLKKIGEFYYKKFADEEPIDTEIQEFCDAAAGHYEIIDQAQAEIDRIKKERRSRVNRTPKMVQRGRNPLISRNPNRNPWWYALPVRQSIRKALSFVRNAVLHLNLKKLPVKINPVLNVRFAEKCCIRMPNSADTAAPPFPRSSPDIRQSFRCV